MENKLQKSPWREISTLLNINEKVLALGAFRTTASALSIIFLRAYAFTSTKPVYIVLTNSRVIVLPVKNFINLKNHISISYDNIQIDDNTLFIFFDGENKPLKLKFSFKVNGLSNLDKENFISVLHQQKFLD